MKINKSQTQFKAAWKLNVRQENYEHKQVNCYNYSGIVVIRIWDFQKRYGQYPVIAKRNIRQKEINIVGIYKKKPTKSGCKVGLDKSPTRR